VNAGHITTKTYLTELKRRGVLADPVDLEMKPKTQRTACRSERSGASTTTMIGEALARLALEDASQLASAFDLAAIGLLTRCFGRDILAAPRGRSL